MLVLTREVEQEVVIDGRIRVKVTLIRGNKVKLGIDAPPEVSVHRAEVWDAIQRDKKEREGSVEL